MPIRKAVIPAAGLGTRFLPATKAVPKEMLPVVDTPAIQLVVEEAVAAGLTDDLIAEQLVLSPHTVHRHVSNIRLKLDAPSRAAAAAAATRQGLI